MTESFNPAPNAAKPGTPERAEEDLHLAEAETWLLHVLETQRPPQDPGLFDVTAAARAFHDEDGGWDVKSLGEQGALDLLRRHRA